MKSLSSIIGQLSSADIDAFRVFLKSHRGQGAGKRLALFERILLQKEGDTCHSEAEVSRQSIYQLKKKLQRELYSFLMSQDQSNVSDELLHREMDCHRKLYCFKILLDKGIRDHAHDVLSEVLEVAAAYSLHGLYLEAKTLNDTFFPSADSPTIEGVVLKDRIAQLRDDVDSNAYVNRYLLEWRRGTHLDDAAFRKAMLNGGNVEDNSCKFGPHVCGLLEANRFFLSQDYAGAFNCLRNATSQKGPTSRNDVTTLLYVELCKACAGMGDIISASHWLNTAIDNCRGLEKFQPVILELKLLLLVRQQRLDDVDRLVSDTLLSPVIAGSEVLSARWCLFRLFSKFLRGQKREVIKDVNQDKASLLKWKDGLCHAKFLELLCILRLDDLDWLHYKVDTFRKAYPMLSGKSSRLGMLVDILKTHTGSRRPDQMMLHRRTAEVNALFGWHPLGVELVDYSLLICDTTPARPEVVPSVAEEVI